MKNDNEIRKYQNPRFKNLIEEEKDDDFSACLKQNDI